MSLRSQTAAMILASTLLVASPAAAATGSWAAGRGDLLQLAGKFLTQVAAWLTVSPGTQWAKSDTAQTQEIQDAVDDPGSQEGVVIDPNGRLSKSR